MNIKDKLEKIDNDYLKLLSDIGKVSKEINQKSYLVGGMVRDLLLDFNNLDIDIVVEDNAALLADTLVKKIPGCELSAKHDRFHTAKVIFNVNEKKIPVDLASTRTETYEFPGALPTVEKTDSLKKDLNRRDFTINALAVSLLPDSFGNIVDSFGGLDDLKNKLIRVVPNEKIFDDDPTRMIRAIRFATKFGFEIEGGTYKLLRETINSGKFDNLIEKIRGDRVKIEIRYLFNLPNTEKAINIFFESGVYKIISTKLQNPSIGVLECKSLGKEQWLCLLALIINKLDTDVKNKIMSNLQMTGDEVKIITSAFNTNKLLLENKNLDSLLTYKLLKGLPKQSIQILQIICRSVAHNSSLINEYLSSTSKIKLEISGQDLISLGVKPGKELGEILDKVFEAKINNSNMSKEDELKEAKKFILD